MFGKIGLAVRIYLAGWEDRIGEYRANWNREHYPKDMCSRSIKNGPSWMILIGGLWEILKVSRTRWCRLWRSLQFCRRIAHVFPLSDVVNLGYGWDSVYRIKSGGDPRFYPCLELIYVGDATCEEEAKSDLGNIMLHFKTIFRDLEPTYAEGKAYSRPRGQYQGIGRLGSLPIAIKMEVPWLPEECLVKEIVQTQKMWSVTCGREA